MPHPRLDSCRNRPPARSPRIYRFHSKSQMRETTPSPSELDSKKGYGSEYLVADSSNLRSRTRRAAAFGTASQVAVAAIGLVSVSILSRSVTPSDVGLVGISMVVLSVISSFSESGFAFAAEQQDQVSHAQMSILFWANLALGCAVCAVSCMAAPLVAWAYGRPELVLITAGLGVALLASSVSLQHAALLRRQLHFGRLALVQVGSRLAALGIAVVVAQRGGGYWALVAQEVVAATARAAFAWSLCSWRPSAPRRGASAMPLIRLGAGRSLAETLGALRRQVDPFFVGCFLGPEALGYYNRALALFIQPLSSAIHPLTKVAVPALSRVQADRARFRSAMSEGLSTLAFLTLPICGFIAVASEGLVEVALGPAWKEVVPIMRAFVLGMAVTCTLWPAVAWGFSAFGRTRAQAMWSAASLAIAAACCGAGSAFGTVGIAWGMSLSACIILPLGARMALAGSGFGARDIAATFAIPLAMALIASVIATVTISLSAPLGAPSSTACAAAAFAVSYAAAFSCSKRGRSEIGKVKAALTGAR